MARRRTAAVVVLWTSLAAAVEVRLEPAAENVYADVGDIGARSVANEGLDANLGLVATPAAAALIDSGATWRSARDIQAAARRVTTQPIRCVINTGTRTAAGWAMATSRPRAPNSLPMRPLFPTCGRVVATCAFRRT